MTIINFKGALKPKVKSAPIYHTILYIDKQWYVRVLGNLIPVQIPDISAATVLYSLPTNDKYPAWTKKKVNKGVKPIALTAWATVYDKQRVTGYIKDKKFIITGYAK